MLTKEKLLASINAMPEDEFEDIDILFERLAMLNKIQTGIEQADRGELITLEELVKEMKEW